MFRLAIIDDEESTRQGLRHMLDWAALDIELVGEAADGQEGTALVQQTRPDIIICDVRMPRLDGIALVAQVRPAFPKLQIIFLSGHVEKEYLRSAIRFGALDYLDKPVDRAELLRVIEAAKQRCRDALAERRPENYGQIAASLIAGQLPHDDPALARGPVDWSAPYHTLVYSFNLPQLKAMGSGVDPEDPDAFLQQHFPDYQRALYEAFPHGALMHIYQHHYVGHVNPAPEQDVLAVSRGLLHSLQEHVPHVAIGISSPARGASGAAASYQQALATKRNFFEGYDRVFSVAEQKATGTYQSGDAPIDDIIRLIRDQQFASATVQLSGCMDTLRQYQQTDIPAIRADLSRLALELGSLIRPDDQAFQFTVMENVKRTHRCLPDIYHFLLDLLGSLISSQESLSSKGRTIYDVERYIVDHSHQELSIQTIADSVYLTPTYLCYLYKKATGKTINTFITEVKIEKAKHLLKDSTLRLSDIAEMLGYASQNYLTRIFTKTVGMSPTMYRNSML